MLYILAVIINKIVFLKVFMVNAMHRTILWYLKSCLHSISLQYFDYNCDSHI